MQQLDDHLVMLQSMGFSPHKKPFEERLAKWEVQLRLVRFYCWLGGGLCGSLLQLTLCCFDLLRATLRS
jgi:hypothetical protein